MLVGNLYSYGRIDRRRFTSCDANAVCDAAEKSVYLSTVNPAQCPSSCFALIWRDADLWHLVVAGVASAAVDAVDAAVADAAAVAAASTTDTAAATDNTDILYRMQICILKELYEYKKNSLNVRKILHLKIIHHLIQHKFT